jgi:hypothetical protein
MILKSKCNLQVVLEGKELSLESLDVVEAYTHHDLVLIKQHADVNSSEVDVTSC